YWQGNLQEARQIYEEAIPLGREIHQLNVLAYSLRRLGYIDLLEGDAHHAGQLFRESLEINRELGYLVAQGACLAAFAAANLVWRNPEKAAVLCGHVEHLLQRIGSPLFYIDTFDFERTIAQTRKALDDKVLSAAWSQGGSMSLDQAIEFALQ